jgi:hypothetical protein
VHQIASEEAGSSELFFIKRTPNNAPNGSLRLPRLPRAPTGVAACLREKRGSAALAIHSEVVCRYTATPPLRRGCCISVQQPRPLEEVAPHSVSLRQERTRPRRTCTGWSCLALHRHGLKGAGRRNWLSKVMPSSAFCATAFFLLKKQAVTASVAVRVPPSGKQS